jgi:hypothetical protein
MRGHSILQSIFGLTLNFYPRAAIELSPPYFGLVHVTSNPADVISLAKLARPLLQIMICLNILQ